MSFTLGQLKKFIEDNQQLPDTTRIVLDIEDHMFREITPSLNEALVVKAPRQTLLHEWSGYPGDYGYISAIEMAYSGATVEKVITFQ